MIPPQHTHRIGAFLALAAVIVAGCSSHGNGKVDRAVEGMLPLEARAIDLREERFALANRIRFTQDTLGQTGSDSARLQRTLTELTARRDSLLSTSLRLADTLRRRLDSLMSHDLTERDERERFSRKLNEALTKRGYRVEGGDTAATRE